MVRLGLLTSSRADFGVYLPLIKSLKTDKLFDLQIIAFGSHLSVTHGLTVQEIEAQGFHVNHRIASLLSYDDVEAISTNVGITMMKFASFWSSYKDQFDFVLCLGDRYEMFSAVLAGIPYGIKFVHFYGGDTSLGSFDNVYRDCITSASSIHFTSTDRCAKRVRLLTGSDKVYQVGILSLEEIHNLKLLNKEEFFSKWNIDLAIPSVLITFHPETVNNQVNAQHILTIRELLSIVSTKYQVIVTMPNADTNGSEYREMFYEMATKLVNLKLVENFGLQSYFTCLHHTKMVIGNTSSGISEAPSFGKYFVNVGSRQTGREMGGNVLSVPYNLNDILEAIAKVELNPIYEGTNIYYRPDSINLVKSVILST